MEELYGEWLALLGYFQVIPVCPQGVVLFCSDTLLHRKICRYSGIYNSKPIEGYE